ncbi:hypothetical protein NQ318_002717 [Aromia moschata]|uniref:DDE Tnp4 domain-containing protein n=1 Tax=Aromia moschata TaxID=1265417 RepID=A0AAV8Y4R8_9CUCU|nr:hypothetical protein NQ318_002717 [Aromia moschata]
MNPPLIEHQIKSQTDRNNAISPAAKLLLTLRFYATGCMLITAGDFIGVSKASACYIVTKVTEAIASLRERYIKFPGTQFPQVIGVIDCTHVRIMSSGGNEAERYRNRKGFFSWNVQTICDARLRIIDIVARWPGSSHDQTIYNNSRVKGTLQDNEFGNSIILGDSGYANTNYLITPLDHPNIPAEVLFNESHVRTRNCVERSYGVWKRRFPVLSVGIRVSLDHSKAIVVATAVLHNIAIEENENKPPIEIEMEDVPVPLSDVLVRRVAHENNRMRNSLINNNFTNLL